MSCHAIAIRPTLLWAGLLGLVGAGHSILATPAVGAGPIVLEVSAGKYDRQDTPVSCQLTDAVRTWRGVQLVDAVTHQAIAAQIDHSQPPRLLWILDDPLKAGAARRYVLTEGAPPAESASVVQVVRDDRVVRLEIEHHPVLAYNHAVVPSDDPREPAFERSGFIHPIFDPAGGVLTDGMPPDHMHQHALWFAWVNTTFEGRNVDFWNSTKHLGKVKHVGLRDVVDGPVCGSFTASLEHIDLTAPEGPKTALLETWLVRGYRHAGGYLFDIQSSQSCASESPLTINQNRYGGMALRGAREWTGKKACAFLTNEGKDRASGNHTPARWCEMSGEMGNHQSGIAVFCHPSNFRAPQPVRLEPGNKPYFCYAPMVPGSFTIEPGKPYVSTYRYYVHTGPADAQLNDALWNNFADPPTAKIVMP